jgi:hypothetical protein
MNGLGEGALFLSVDRPRQCVTCSWAVHSWLSGIDCPDKGQAYGNNAKHAASDLAFGKQVTVQTHGKDKYGRTIADMILLDFN